MANWLHKIELNAVIAEVSEEYDLECVEEKCPQEAKESLALEVEKAPPIAHFGALIRKCKSIAAVNRMLERIFNAADAQKVWCGMPFRVEAEVGETK